MVVLDRQMMDPKGLLLQQVLVVHRPHQHSIHSLDSHRQLLLVTDPQVDPQAQDQIMAPRPQLVLDQTMDPDPQLVTQVHSDEASLILRPHRLVAHRDLQQIMLMEVLRQHHRYSVASLQRHLLVDRRDQVDNKDQQVERKVRQLEHSRDQVHLMVRLL